MKTKIEKLTGAEVYESSISESGKTTYFLARKGLEKLVGSVGKSNLTGSAVGKIDGESVFIGPVDAVNAAAIRAALPWTGPRLVGLARSAGVGDRLGIATPGHIRALRGYKIEPVLAQQSIREMTRTGRNPQQVMDCATWGVFQEGFAAPGGFGADADHLQQPADIDVTLASGFTMFTIDPGKHVEDAADTMSATDLASRFERLDFAGLEISAADLRRSYAGKNFKLPGGVTVSFDEAALTRAAVKYGNAIAHVARMFRHLKDRATTPIELEVSVDETASPTSTAEHYFFAAELKRLNVMWVSMAPRFIGRFEKGVDYIGDLDEFRRSFKEHVAVMRALGPYKMSIHSGSDKFSIYAIVAELTEGLVHLKTAGTSYLEALRALAKIDPPLFREILAFARGRYETDKATYHVSAQLAKVPAPQDLKDEQLPALLDSFDARQVLHVTFGSVLTAEGGKKFRDRLIQRLLENEEVHYATLEKHLRRHIEPLVK